MALLLRPVLLLYTVIFYTSAQNALNDNEKKDALNIHNNLRSSVWPEASNMNTLTWSDTLESSAVAWAQKCAFDHSGQYGENLRLAGDKNMTKGLMSFFAEREGYDYFSPGGGKCTGVECGHYLQIVTDYVTEVGCAAFFCEEVTEDGKKISTKNYLTVCQYSNFRHNSQVPYKSGSTCQYCPASHAVCDKGLCSSQAECTKTRASCSCDLSCRNCGSKVDVSGRCLCSCLSGWTGSDCSEKLGGATPEKCTSPCKTIGLKCVNGKEDTSSLSQCICLCQSGYSGDLCDIDNNAYTNGVLLTMYGESYKRQQYYPIAPSSWATMQTAYLQSLADEINQMCKQNTCGIDTKAELVKTSEIRTAHPYPQATASGALLAVIYVARTVVHQRYSGNQYVEADILLQAVQNTQAKLADCCGVSKSTPTLSKELLELTTMVTTMVTTNTPKESTQTNPASPKATLSVGIIVAIALAAAVLGVILIFLAAVVLHKSGVLQTCFKTRSGQVAFDDGSAIHHNSDGIAFRPM